jgi:hypothetical protein
MSPSASKLRLGPLPKTETVKLTITMSIELKAMLDRYADLHAQAWSEPVDVLTLIPHMLAAFMERDRGFKALRSKPGRSVTSPQPAASSSTAQM